MRGIIFGAGEYDYQFPEFFDNDIIIAADGGLRVLRDAGIEPHLVIGDFDSLGFTPRSGSVEKLPVNKDITDLNAAVNAARKLGCTEIHIYGGMGGRPDHTFANVALTAKLSKNGVKAYMYGEGCMITAVTDGEVTVYGKTGATVSVFSFSDDSAGVTYSGLLYPLNNAALKNDFALGVSNSLTGTKADISVKKGTLIITVQR